MSASSAKTLREEHRQKLLEGPEITFTSIGFEKWVIRVLMFLLQEEPKCGCSTK